MISNSFVDSAPAKEADAEESGHPFGMSADVLIGNSASTAPILTMVFISSTTPPERLEVDVNRRHLTGDRIYMDPATAHQIDFNQ